MKLYLHLADSGLVLADLSAHLYNETGEILPINGLSLVPLSNGTSYELSGLPDTSGSTLTIDYPAGVFSAYRFGSAESQPSNVIIPIREVFSNPLVDLSIAVFQDGVSLPSNDLTVSQLSLDGDYAVSGWVSPSPLGSQFSVRWDYYGQTFSVHWVGVSVSALPHTSYHFIEAVQRPFLLPQLDAEGRSVYSVNFVGHTNGSTSTFEDEIAKLLDDNNIATLITDLFIGVVPNFPNGDGPYTQIINTGGRSSEQAHDNSTEEYPRIQILVRAKGNKSARDKVFEIYDLIDKTRDVLLSA